VIEALRHKKDSFSARLLNDSIPYWNHYLRHPFLQKLANGTLSHDRYTGYMMQDYLYLKEYGRCFLLGMVKGTDPAFRAVCEHYLKRINNFELDVHRGAFEALGISKQDLERAVPSLENLGYTSYMLKVCLEGKQEEILISILACALSYEYIAHEIVKEKPEALNDPLYGSWFAQYDSADYAKENEDLCALLDDLTRELSKERLDALENIFETCSRFEMGFWNGAWQTGDETRLCA